MSRHLAFRRQPVDQQIAQRLQTTTFPAPTRGLIMSESQAYMQPGGTLVQDNWVSTMRGVKLRGGCIRWCDLHGGLPVPHPALAGDLGIRLYLRHQRAHVRRQRGHFVRRDFQHPTVIKSGQHSGNYAAAQMSTRRPIG